MFNENLSNESEKKSKLNPTDITVMFENILPPPTDDELQQLEINIQKDGEIRDPLVIWKSGNKNMLVDGIIRHRIALKHRLECPVVYYEFPSIEEVKAFVLTNQLGRRNLSDYSKCELVLQLEEYYTNLGRKNQSKGGEGCQISDKDKVDTKKMLGVKAGVSHDTVAKVKVITTSVTDPEIINNLRQGTRSINSVYKTLNNKKSNLELVQTVLFNEFGDFIPDMSTIKSLTITPTTEGYFRIELITAANKKQVCETVNQIVITEIKPNTAATAEILPNTSDEETQPKPVTSIYKLLDTLYNDYDFGTIVNPKWEDLRTMYIEDVRKLHKYVSLQMAENSKFRVFTETLRLQLLKNWQEKNQPLGGGKKTNEKIIAELKKFKAMDPSSILTSEDSGEMDVLNTCCKLTSGVNQYFPEMLDTRTGNGKSPMDVIKDSKKFLQFVERIFVSDNLHLFSKSPEYKENQLKKAA